MKLSEYFYYKLSLLNRCDIIGDKKAVDPSWTNFLIQPLKTGRMHLCCCSDSEDLLNFLYSQRPQPYVFNKVHLPIFHLSNHWITTWGGVINSNKRGDSTLCFDCRLKGHPYYKCTKPIVKCRRCSRIGDDNEDCELQSVKSASTSGDIVTENKFWKLIHFPRTTKSFLRQ